MKIIIEYSRTKREISGPFNICASHQDLKRLVDQIQTKLDKGHTYGWIEILDSNQVSVIDTPPQPWD